MPGQYRLGCYRPQGLTQRQVQRPQRGLVGEQFGQVVVDALHQGLPGGVCGWRAVHAAYPPVSTWTS